MREAEGSCLLSLECPWEGLVISDQAPGSALNSRLAAVLAAGDKWPRKSARGLGRLSSHSLSP